MRIVANEFMSLDGVLQAPGGPEEDTSGGFKHGGWSMKYFDREVMGPFIVESMGNADAFFFGRRTWEVSASHWPEQSDPLADMLNPAPKYVTSNTLTEADMKWNTTLLAGDAIEAFAKLRTEGDGVLLTYGSLSLVRGLLSAGLVDELNVMIEPIMLGGGKRLFPEDGVARPMKLVSSKTGSTGVQLCTYEPA